VSPFTLLIRTSLANPVQYSKGCETGSSQFTGNVALSVLARIEDCDISRREQLLRLTPWVTQPRMLAEFKHQTPFTVANQTHFVVETNHPKDIPIHDQDCRFVVIEVSSLTQRDVEFTRKLQEEAPAFLDLLLNVKLPAREEHFGRLALPDVSTSVKEEIAESNLTAEEMFANECLKEGDGFVSNGELWEAFGQWCHRTRKVNPFSDSQEFVRRLGSWFTARGIPSDRRSIRGEKLRGRSGVQLKA